MAGFTGRDDIINEATTNGKQDVWNFYKIAPAAPEGGGVWTSLWKGVGNPGAGVNPAASTGTSYISDSDGDNDGAMWFSDRSADKRFLMSFGALATRDCTLMLYDRLIGVSGISCTTTGNKTVNSVALDRYTGTDAVCNEVWLEVTTASTTTAAIVDLNQYTSADGTTGVTGGSVTFPSTNTDLHTLVQMPQSATRQGVRSVEVGLHVGTATTNMVVNLLIIRPLARIPLLANQWNEISFLDDTMSLPRIFDNATLGLALLASSALSFSAWGIVNCVYG